MKATDPSREGAWTLPEALAKLDAWADEEFKQAKMWAYQYQRIHDAIELAEAAYRAGQPASHKCLHCGQVIATFRCVKRHYSGANQPSWCPGSRANADADAELAASPAVPPAGEQR